MARDTVITISLAERRRRALLVGLIFSAVGAVPLCLTIAAINIVSRQEHPWVWWLTLAPFAFFAFDEVAQRCKERSLRSRPNAGRHEAAAGIIALQMGAKVTRLTLGTLSGMQVEVPTYFSPSDSALLDLMTRTAPQAQNILDGPSDGGSKSQRHTHDHREQLHEDATRVATLANTGLLQLDAFEGQATPSRIIDYALGSAVRILADRQGQVRSLAKALKRDITIGEAHIQQALHSARATSSADRACGAP